MNNIFPNVNISCKQNSKKRSVSPSLTEVSAGALCCLANAVNTAGTAVEKTAARAADCPGFEKMTSSLLMCGVEDACSEGCRAVRE